MSTLNNDNDVCPHGLYNFCAKCYGERDAAAATYTRDVFDTVMSSPTIEKKTIRLAGPRALGFRAFDSLRESDGTALYPLGVQQASWSKGEQPAAICARGEAHVQGQPVVALDCTCGYHAYKDVASMHRGLQHDTYAQWVGVVIGWGRIAPHVDGWRAERVRLVALLAPMHKENAEATAERYGVPLFRYDFAAQTSTGFPIGAKVFIGPHRYSAMGFVIGDHKVTSKVRIAIAGRVVTRDASELRVADHPAYATDGASRSFATYAEAVAAIEAFAQQFGEPLDDLYARYAKPAVAATSVQQIKQAFANALRAPFAGVQPTAFRVKTARQKLYDRKWRDAKRAGAAPFAKFKSDWAAGLVTDAWRP